MKAFTEMVLESLCTLETPGLPKMFGRWQNDFAVLGLPRT